MAKKVIEKEKLLVVEGADDKEVLETLLAYLKIPDCQILTVKGKENFRDLVEIRKIPGFDQLKILGVVRDANDDGEATFKSTKNYLARAGVGPPVQPNIFTEEEPKVGVFLFKKPNENNGTLEHLFLESVKAEPVMACVEEFWDCREKVFKEPPKKPAKAKSWTYCSAMPEPAYRVGVAATKGFWNLDAEALQPVKEFLENFH